MREHLAASGLAPFLHQGARRAAVWAGACLMSVLQACGGGGSADTTPDAATLKLAASAFEYGYPLTETMRVCNGFARVNALSFKSTLASPADTAVVRPNNDTLYASACVWLGAGTVAVSMPPALGRYMSMQVLDAWTDNVAVKGPAQIPAGGANFILRLAGSGSALTSAPGTTVIDVDTPYAYVLFRTLVNGPADVAQADTLQRAITLTPASPSQPVRAASTSSSAGLQFFLRLSQGLAQNPPPDAQASLVASFAAAGLNPTLTPSVGGLTVAQQSAWDSAYSQGLALLDAGVLARGTRRGGWNFPPANLGVFGTDYAYRAQIARSGLFALPASEAIYLSTAQTLTGDTLEGRTPRVLRLPPGWPPVEAGGFWSLTVYSPTGFLVDNPIARYSLSDRTPGVSIAADGSLSIYLQCTDPGGLNTANWLPTPCGAYNLSLRLYRPLATVSDPAFTVPGVQ